VNVTALMRSESQLALIGSLALFAIQLSGQVAATNFSRRLAPVPPCSTLVAAAQTNQIPLEQIDSPTPDGAGWWKEEVSA